MERQAAEATNSNETILLPWLRTQANLKTNAEEGNCYILLEPWRIPKNPSGIAKILRFLQKILP